ncbi:acetyl/propionyl/methylcrotonyl-CoA carboxylase subunit alpha [Pelagibius sp. CAU 1746]|uniref:acetyl/propionyl/methylcrotonyl-CoA carboxylase subunit alpha n=1 Tax=Pelagibius sp. CAU 1746 TaxID=3140370 RepID=UPI00325B6EEE
MFEKLLIANRGEIACRIIRTAKKLGIATVAVYSDADRDALHVRMADEAVHLGPPPASQSYLDAARLLAAAKTTGATAVHPGYGFLSENASFAKTLEAAGVIFVGPPPAAIEAMGDKITSKGIAAAAGVNTVPGHMGVVEDVDQLLRIARDIGYPVMIKASAGGGGKGMRIAWSDADAREGFEASRNEARASFDDDRIFVEKFVDRPRHIEIQVLGDRHGNLIYLGERECSIQRRNQKVIEEAPSPFLDPATRKAMGEQAVALCRAVGYFSAGTVEFIVDGDRNFYFLEMNTRLQVEHPVTELITGIDLVEEMIRVAAGERLSLSQADVMLDGWAIESRIYAEDPYRNFLPSIGRLTRYRPPAEGVRDSGAVVRNDTGVFEGAEISMFYDPMVAKLCTWAPSRPAAIDAMAEALDDFEVEGIGHNLPFLSAVMLREPFRQGDLTTAFIAEEFPEGFENRRPCAEELRRLASVAAWIQHVSERRDAQIAGSLSRRARAIGPARVIALLDARFEVTVRECPGGLSVAFGDDGEDGILEVLSDWRPGCRQAAFQVGGTWMGVKTTPAGAGWRLRWRAVDATAQVRRPRVAELAQLMPVKVPPDRSRMLLCPMPGVITQLHAREGDAVEVGQALATVEAMKMENLLRAERQGTVKRVAVETGASLAVDEVIMEFA